MRKLLQRIRRWFSAGQGPYGVPYTDRYGNPVITYRTYTPVWDDGVLHLGDGSTIVWSNGNERR